ncbi:MAG: hypothetical protein Q4B22_03845 [Eubacteriales bacterium]|nr:hypothetical protein [Eubacteriales bacterium]
MRIKKIIHTAAITAAACTLVCSNPCMALAKAPAVTVAAADIANDYATEAALKNAEEEIFRDYLSSIQSRENELQNGKITIGSSTMKLQMKVIGSPDANGYPLYIVFHGGSSGDPAIEDEQFDLIFNSGYSNSVKSGVYIATRGITDVFD